MNWEYFFNLSRKSFYTSFAMEFFSMLLICIYFLISAKKITTKYLVILAISSLLQVLAVQNNELKHGSAAYSQYIDQRLMYIYLIIEIGCCLFYIRANIQSIIAKRLTLACLIAYAIYTITYWSLHYKEKYLPAHIEITEGFIIILFCLYYFYELFTLQPDKNLPREPSFWAISGMLFLFCAITPLFLFYDYLRKSISPLANSLYAINNISYSLLFITFIVTILLDQKKKRSTFHFPNYYPV